MVGVAQWLERRSVAPEAAGSSPVIHPLPAAFHLHPIDHLSDARGFARGSARGRARSPIGRLRSPSPSCRSVVTSIERALMVSSSTILALIFEVSAASCALSRIFAAATATFSPISGAAFARRVHVDRARGAGHRRPAGAWDRSAADCRSSN